VLIDSSELIGKALGSCTLQSLLGRGGMGAVYLARQTRPRRTVAVKVLMPAISMEQRPRTEFLARFRREADAIAALDHINIMPIYEYGEQGDVAYLVMPYITGGTLREVIERRGPLPIGEIVSIIEQAGAALDTAHHQNIIHRDLKPGNMLFHADGRLLLADFGLAKVLRDPSEELGRKQTELTSVGTIIGTPEYLSPEQGTGKDLDYRTDVYSLGIVLYQMLAGRVPFMGTTPVAIALKHALELPPPLSQFNPTVTPEVEAVVQKTLAKLPEQRYSSAGELARALRAAANENGEQTESNYTSMAVDEPSPNMRSEEDKLDYIEKAEGEQEKLVFENYSTLNDKGEKPAQEQQKLTFPKDEKHAEGRPNIHSDKTEEAPRIEKSLQAVAHVPETHHRYGQEQHNKLQLPAQQQVAGREGQTARPRLQSVRMMLLGSLLTLVIIVGGVGAYIQFAPKTIKPSSTLHSQVTPGVRTTPTAGTGKPTTLSLPAAMIAQAGTLLYGTDQPGTNCDKRGGTWSSSKNAQVSCSQGTSIRNNDPSTLAGTFLDKLPQGKVMPGDYVLQVQITVNPNSAGEFGVFVRNQPGSQTQGTYSILLAPPNTWRAYEYDNTSGAPTTLVAGINTQAPLIGTFTIDVLVQGSTYTLFINGNQEGYAQSGTYMTGNVGLAIDTGANVSFKNLEVFTIK
jgi:serine/threonine protein kinase